MASRKRPQVVIESTDDGAVPTEAPAEVTVKRTLRVTAVSSDGRRSTRNAPRGIREPGDIFAVEVTRTNLPEWRINWYHATKAEANAEARSLPGRIRKSPSGDVVKARVVPAEAYYVEVPVS